MAGYTAINNKVVIIHSDKTKEAWKSYQSVTDMVAQAFDKHIGEGKGLAWFTECGMQFCFTQDGLSGKPFWKELRVADHSQNQHPSAIHRYLEPEEAIKVDYNRRDFSKFYGPKIDVAVQRMCERFHRHMREAE